MKSFLYLVAVLSLISCASSKNEKSESEKRGDLFFSRGTSHLMKGNHTKALKNLLQAEKLSPNNSEIINNLGMAYFFKKDTKSALSNIQKALKIDPKNTDARMNYASILFHLKKYKSSEKQYQLVLKDLTYEKQQRTHYNLGLLYDKVGKKKSALQNYRAALEIDPYYCPANFKIAMLAYKKSKFSLASEQFHNATKGNCYKNILGHLFRAKSLRKIGQNEKALKKYEQILNDFPGNKYSSTIQKAINNTKSNMSAEDKGLDLASLKEKYEQLSSKRNE